MNILRQYIAKQTDNRFILNEVSVSLASIFVVIPCFNEPDLLKTLDSLYACVPPKSTVCVIVVVNSSDDSPVEVLTQNTITLSQIESWKKDHPGFFDIYPIYTPALPGKFAGVGWARKIGMDMAVRQLDRSNQEDGFLVSLDADSIVSPDYLEVIEKAFQENTRANFFTINFAHSLKHDESPETEEGILRYELHMRYYRNAVKWCGYPHAIHTVGSSFAVRASAYVKQGGMNRRKAGEDFYFLHKIVLLGDYGNINSTTVFPSSRQSDRVPFGTGAAMKKWAGGNSELKTSYNFEAFIPLKQFFTESSRFFRMDKNEIKSLLCKIPIALSSFIEESESIKTILELQKNCSNEFTFSKRFFHHMNAFWILKYLNFAHEKFFCRGELFSQATRLLKETGIQVSHEIPALQLLNYYRNLDKEL